MVEQVDQIVQMVADKLGVVVDEVYPILLKQADVTIHMYHISIWVFAIALILTLIAVACCVWADVNFCSKYSDSILATSIGVIIVCGTIAVIGGIVLAVDFTNYVTALYNPDMYVINAVTEMLQ